MVAPVAVGADPDLEQRRLVLLHRQVAGRGERLDPRPRPDEREAECQARPSPSSRCLPRGRSLPRARPPATPSCRGGGARAHAPLRPLRSRWRAACARAPGRSWPLAPARAGASRRPPPGKPSNHAVRERRRLADHAVGCLRTQRELEADAAVTARRLLGQLERAGGGRPRVVVGVARGGSERRPSRHRALRPPRRPRGRSAPARPRAGRRRRRSPSSARSSSGRGRCRARGRPARRAPPLP